jgi:hypothetical protein
LRPRHPEPGGDQPAAERFDGQRERVLLGELLVRERGPEVGVALADEGQGALAGGVREAAATRAAPAARRANASYRRRTWRSLRRKSSAARRRVSRRSAIRVMTCRRSSSFMLNVSDPGIRPL